MANVLKEEVKQKRRTLSPDLLEKARVELNEVQSEVSGHIETLRQRILEDPITDFRTDDVFLLRFLRARKFDQDRAFELMTNYYRNREYYPHLFSKSKSELEKILDSQIMGVLPNRDSDGRALILFLVERWNTNDVSLEELIVQFMVTLEVLLEDEAIQISGTVWICEMTGFGLSHVVQMNPWKIKEAATVLLNSFPVRLKGGHYVNESPIFDGVYLITKVFLSKKIQERIVFHGNCLASLHEYLSPEILPDELGGDLNTVDFREWNEILLQNFDRIAENFKYGFAHPV